MSRENRTARPAPQQAQQVAGIDEAMPAQSAIRALAYRLGVQASAVFLSSLRNVAFRSPDVSNEQLMALVVVANQYQLNPFTRELYAFPEKPERGGGIVPVVSVDGWLRIINDHAQNDGIEYEEVLDDSGKLIGGKCTVHRKDRSHPTVVIEKLSEIVRNTDPWRLMPSRMMRHKTIIQAGRVAFGFTGIYEPDEADRILEATARVVATQQPSSGAAAVREILSAEPAAKQVIDATAGAPGVLTSVGPQIDTTAGPDARTVQQDEMPV
jgi:phage recombination protein Bet